MANKYGGKFMDKQNKHIISELLNKIISIVYYFGIGIVILILLQIFCFSSFKIPTNSMEPTLTAGDNIIVCKMIPGARLFNIFASMREEQVNIYRMPGICRIQRNDVVVFNFPHPNNWNKLEMHILKYYIKRCIGLPGDTLYIQNSNYKIRGIISSLGNIEAQRQMAKRTKESFDKNIYTCFPQDSIINWNIQNMGPLYIPKAGDSIQMNRTNYVIYKKLIEWEQKETLIYNDSTVFLNNKKITGYRFQQSYYFMAGDNGIDSQDSRYWGLLPEDFIVGKAWLIWKSVDDYTGNIRWDRILKFIH